MISFPLKVNNWTTHFSNLHINYIHYKLWDEITYPFQVIVVSGNTFRQFCATPSPEPMMAYRQLDSYCQLDIGNQTSLYLDKNMINFIQENWKCRMQNVGFSVQASVAFVETSPMSRSGFVVSCETQGWGLPSQFRPFRYFQKFSGLSKHMLAIEYHVNIWQVSPQLSCGVTCQI